MPGSLSYQRTNPERCYASGDEAGRDGCRAQAEHLTAKAIRESKNLEALVAEILEAVSE